MRSRPRALSRLAVCAALSALALTACSGGDDVGDDGDVEGTGPSIPDSRSDATAAPSTVPISDAAADPTTTPPFVADTGVPGLDSGDAFCRSWSEFAGTFQALALSASLAADPSDATRAEVVASSTIVAAAAGLDENLPAELESEREALTVGLVGPMARRSGAAVDGLHAAGLTDAEIADLGEVWLATLAAAGLDEPIDDIPLDPAIADRVDDAVASFAAGRPSIVEDPTLITDAATPLTFDYLAEHCPDQGTLAGNDNVDQP